MPYSGQEKFEQLVFAGDLGPRMVLIGGALFLLLLAWLTWREARLAGWRRMIPLAILRLVAVGTVLWMLAGPSIKTTVRHQRPKSIDVFMDSSASMGVADPADSTGEALRWAAATGSADQCRPLVEMDQAAAALASAKTQLARLVAECERSGNAGEASESVARLEKLIQNCAEKIDRLAGQAADPKEQDDLREIVANLRETVLPATSSLQKEIGGRDTLLTPERIDQMREAGEALGAPAYRLARLADALAARLAKASEPELVEAARKQSSTSRLNRITGLMEDAQKSWLADIEKLARVNRYRFDTEAVPIDKDWRRDLTPQEGEGDAPRAPVMVTSLIAPIEQTQRDMAAEPVQAVVLLTDGGHNTDRDPLKVASAIAGVPFYIVPIGNAEPIRDVILHQAHAPRTVFMKDMIQIEATVDAYKCEGETLAVELRQGEQVIDSKSIQVGAESISEKVTFSRKAEQMGLYEYSLRVNPVPSEQVADNNQAKLAVEVIEDKIRVFIADRIARWEYRYLRNLFKRDDHIEFQTTLFEPRNQRLGTLAEGDGLPQDLEEWSRYQVAILGDLNPDELSEKQQAMLDEFVSRRGGTVVLIAGDEYMPAAYENSTLGKMMPVQAESQRETEAGYSLLITSEGSSLAPTQLADDPLANDRLWREQLPVFGLSDWSKPRQTSHVLISAMPRAGGKDDTRRVFLCWQQYGRGRVVYLSAPSTYRLRFRHGDTYHYRFWGQLLRWAIARDMAGGSKTVRLTTDKTQYQTGDEVQVSLRLSQTNGAAVAGAKCKVIARKADLPVAELNLEPDAERPGTYFGALKGLPLGQVTLEAEGKEIQSLLAAENFAGPVSTTVSMEPEAALEMRNTRCNLPLLTKIADASGGVIIPPTGLEAALTNLDLTPDVIEDSSQRPLWTRWYCLWIFVGCLSAEWIIRKRTGMA